MTTEQLKTLTKLQADISNLGAAINYCENNIICLRNNNGGPRYNTLDIVITNAISKSDEILIVEGIKNQLIAIKAPLDAEFASFILSKPV